MMTPLAMTLGRLLDLPPGWDGHGAPRIDPDCTVAALAVAMEVMQEGTPLPAAVPTSRGGVQLEWHTRGIDLEVDVVSPTSIHGSFEDLRTGESWDAELSFDLTPLKAAVRRLSLLS